MEGDDGSCALGSETKPEEETRIRNVAGATMLKGGSGLQIAGWTIQTRKCTILKMEEVESSLELKHDATGIKIHYNALDALRGWKREALPPVEVSAAAKWKFSRNTSQEMILDYDYTFTTPYCGSESVELHESCAATVVDSGREAGSAETSSQEESSLFVEWVKCEEQIDMVMLQQRDPILFFDEVVLYEDELADNGVSLLTAKVRVMSKYWFLLLRFWLRVDGVLMRLRDTRVFCKFGGDPKEIPVVLRERCIKEETFQSLASKGYPKDASAYADPTRASERIRTKLQTCEKLILRR